MKHQITVKGIQLFCYHGVAEEERFLGGKYEIDVIVGYDFSAAALNDDIGAGVDYSNIIGLVTKLMTERSFRLIEKASMAIAAEILKEFSPVLEVEVAVRKYNVPVNAQLEYTEARVKACRGEL